MEQNVVRKVLQIDGMTCTSCEMRIENVLKKLEGIVDDYKVKNKPIRQAALACDIKKTPGDKIPINQLLAIGIILFALYLIIKNTIGFNFIPVKETKILTVGGMSCSHCENSIKKAVGVLNGVYNVMVDLKSKKVTIEYDSDRVDIGTIKDTIEDQGYDVE